MHDRRRSQHLHGIRRDDRHGADRRADQREPHERRCVDGRPQLAVQCSRDATRRTHRHHRDAGAGRHPGQLHAAGQHRRRADHELHGRPAIPARSLQSGPRARSSSPGSSTTRRTRATSRRPTRRLRRRQLPVGIGLLFARTHARSFRATAATAAACARLGALPHAGDGARQHAAGRRSRSCSTRRRTTSITITQPVTILAAGGIFAGISALPGQNAITIAAGPADSIFLRGLVITSEGGNNGILFASGGALYLENMIVRGYSQVGQVDVNFQPAGAAKLFHQGQPDPVGRDGSAHRQWRRRRRGHGRQRPLREQRDRHQGDRQRPDDRAQLAWSPEAPRTGSTSPARTRWR